MIYFGFHCILMSSNLLTENKMLRCMYHSNGLKMMAQEIRNKSFAFWNTINRTHPNHFHKLRKN